MLMQRYAKQALLGGKREENMLAGEMSHRLLPTTRDSKASVGEESEFADDKTEMGMDERIKALNAVSNKFDDKDRVHFE
jgi:hypothetical protein